MSTKTHLVLISAQAVPNFTPVLDERFKPEQIVMLVSPNMIGRSEYLEKIYKPRGVKVSRWLIDDPWDVEHIRGRIEDLLLENDYEEILLNATGGTKPMSIAAYEVFRENDLSIFYIHPEQDRLIWMHPKQVSVDLADRIKLKEYLMAYGAKEVTEVHKAGVMANLRELSYELIKGIQHYQAALSSLNYFAASADNARLISAEMGKDFKGNYRFWQLVELFEQAGLLAKQGNQLSFADENSRFLVNGGWLEMHAYACCLNLKKTLGIQDVSRSVEVRRQQGKHEVLNEIDIALLRDNRLFLLECKTKRFAAGGKKHSEGADVLYKLDSIRDLLGGLQAKAMLISIKKLEQHHFDRARELNIALCCYQDIQFLEEKMAQWLKNGG